MSKLSKTFVETTLRSHEELHSGNKVGEKPDNCSCPGRKMALFCFVEQTTAKCAESHAAHL
jgi:hypothetical protein